MTTATKAKPAPSAELAQLQEARDKAHADLLEQKDKLTAWATKDMPPEFVGLHAEAYAVRRERDHGPNPSRAAYDAANTAYLEVDAALQAFRRERVEDRIAEVVGDKDATESWRKALELLRRTCESYRVNQEEVRAIILDTPGLDGQALDFDGRVDEWYAFALDALATLDSEVTNPGLTPLGQWKAAQGV